jgi:hypothetical protein
VARFVATVVLPVPPFWFTTAMIGMYSPFEALQQTACQPSPVLALYKLSSKL